MTPEDFKKQHLGEWKPDQRAIDLHERLALYYKQTPDDMPNHVAFGYWNRFKQWCDSRGYTREDINRAKKQVCP